MPETDILIVGGGLAGLTSAGALKHAGLDATILDRGERVGQSWESRYERLHLHTVRAHSGLAHFPIPSSYPKYLSKDQYAQYLRDYAAHFNLRIVPRTLVTKVRQAVSERRAGWAVDTDAGTWSARIVVMAAGQFGKPFYPDFSGLADYRGERLHSADYHSGRDFKGKRALVIGAGNSGMEIAVDLAEQGAASVAISVRTGPPVVPRDFLGTPAQVFGILMDPLPPRLSDRVGGALSRLALGDLTRYGFPTPVWAPFSSKRTPVIDVGFVPALKAGRVGVRLAVRAFTPGGAIFADGREEEYDAVIFATGFSSGLADLLEPAGLLDEHELPRFRSGEKTSYPGLYFMGYYDSLRGFMYESNLASQRLAQEIKKLDADERG
jgi:cation diffusion facilitator CzcD-associated flavoprotein CzcO